MKKKTIIVNLLVIFILLGCAHTNKRPKPEFTRLGFGYSKKKNDIYFTKRNYIGALSSTIYFPEPIDVHSKSFIVIDDYFAEDKNNIYYCAKIIVDAYKKTFKILKVSEPIPYFAKLFPNSKFWCGSNEQHIMTRSDYYAKDNNYVYYGEKRINEAQPESFRLLSILYSIDDNNVYYRNNKLSDADVASFEIVAGNLAKDKNYLFFSGNKIAVNDDFRIINEHYFCNKSNVFYSIYLLNFYKTAVDTLHQLNPNEFEVIGNSFAKDNDCVYFRDEIIKDADLESFTVLSPKYSKDNKNVYCGSQLIVGVDSESFIIFSDGSGGKDKNHIILGGKILK